MSQVIHCAIAIVYWMLLMASQAAATTIAAASCSNTAINTAISSAIDGDTITVPAGNCTWSSAVQTSKGITIQGAGIDQTVINGYGFDMTVPDSKSWRITGMTFKGSACIGAYTNSKSWRIDHMEFDTVSPGSRCQNRIIWVEPTGPEYTKGLIDHNNFQNPRAIQIHMRAAGDGGNGEFIRPLGLGTDDAVYIEDNSFVHNTLQISNPTTDCDGGGRLVFRYNTVQNSYFEMHDAIIGGYRSCRKWEVYNNTFAMTYNSGQFTFIALRGGTGVIANNRFNSGSNHITSPIVVGLYRIAQTGGNPWNTLCGRNSGRFTGASTTLPTACTSTGGSCIPTDGPSSSPNGYPCRDQFGFDGNNPQVSRPALIYGNTLNGTAHNEFDFNGPAVPSGYIVNNRDYCTGTTIPSSCNGVSTTYRPYTYPHPLQKGSVSGGSTPGGSISPPPAPTNLQVS